MMRDNAAEVLYGENTPKGVTRKGGNLVPGGQAIGEMVGSNPTGGASQSARARTRETPESSVGSGKTEGLPPPGSRTESRADSDPQNPSHTHRVSCPIEYDSDGRIITEYEDKDLDCADPNCREEEAINLVEDFDSLLDGSGMYDFRLQARAESLLASRRKEAGG